MVASNPKAQEDVTHACNPDGWRGHAKAYAPNMKEAAKAPQAKDMQHSALALRHLAFEDLGLLAPILARLNYAVSYLEVGVDKLDDGQLRDADLLIVLGGPIGAYETGEYPYLLGELRLIAHRLERDLPTLGICLGAQLMAAALGAKVYPGVGKEIGWGAVELTDAGRDGALACLAQSGARVLHWHGDTFDLPAGATRLASTKLYENQAFSFGRNGLGLQFHLEADPRRIEKWLIGHAGELAQAKISPSELRGATAQTVRQAETQAQVVFSRWLGQIRE